MTKQKDRKKQIGIGVGLGALTLAGLLARKRLPKRATANTVKDIPNYVSTPVAKSPSKPSVPRVVPDEGIYQGRVPFKRRPKPVRQRVAKKPLPERPKNEPIEGLKLDKQELPEKPTPKMVGLNTEEGGKLVLNKKGELVLATKNENGLTIYRPVAKGELVPTKPNLKEAKLPKQKVPKVEIGGKLLALRKPLRQPELSDIFPQAKKPIEVASDVVSSKLLVQSPTTGIEIQRRVKGYYRKLGDRLIYVTGHNRKGILRAKPEALSVIKAEDELRRSAFRKTRVVRKEIRYQDSLLNNQKQNYNNVAKEVNEFLEEYDNSITKTPLIRDYVSSITEIKPSVPLSKFNKEGIVSTLDELRVKVLYINEGYDFDGKLLAEVKGRKKNILGQIEQVKSSNKLIIETRKQELKIEQEKLKTLETIKAKYNELFSAYSKDPNYEQLRDRITLQLKELDIDYSQESSVVAIKLQQLLDVKPNSNFSKTLGEIDTKLKSNMQKLRNSIKDLEVENKALNKDIVSTLNEVRSLPENKLIYNPVRSRKFKRLSQEIDNNIRVYEERITKELNNKILEIENNQSKLSEAISRLKNIEIEVEEELLKRSETITNLDREFRAKLLMLNKLVEEDTLDRLVYESIPLKQLYEGSLSAGNRGLSFEEALKKKKQFVDTVVSDLDKLGRKLTVEAKLESSFGKVSDTFKYNFQKQILYNLKEIKRLGNSIDKDVEFVRNKSLDIAGELDAFLGGIEKDYLTFYKDIKPNEFNKLLEFHKTINNVRKNKYIDWYKARVYNNAEDLKVITERVNKLYTRKPKIRIYQDIESKDTIDIISSSNVNNNLKVEIKEDKYVMLLNKRAKDIRDFEVNTRKRKIIIPVLEIFNSRNIKVEGTGNIFDNYRAGKLTEGQAKVIKEFNKSELKVFKDFVSTNIDKDAIKFFYLSRLTDVLESHVKRGRIPLKTQKMNQVKGLINNLKRETGKDIKLKFNRDTKLLELEGLSDLGRMNSRTLQTVKELEYLVGITDDGVSYLKRIDLLKYLSGDSILGHKDYVQLLKVLDDELSDLSINDYLRIQGLLKERVKQLDLRLYASNFSAKLNVVKFSR